MACNLAYLFNYASRWCCEDWASQFPFLHNSKDLVPPSEACLYGHISWLLAQAHNQSSLGLSQSSSSVKGDRAKPKAGFQFNVLKWSVPESGGASLEKFHLDTKPDLSEWGGGKLAEGVLTSSTDSQKRGNPVMVFLMCCSLQLDHLHLHLL